MTQPSEAWSNPRNNLDVLRFLFASLVIFSHCFPLTRGAAAAGYDPLERLTNGLLSFGALSVVGFFIISGFLVTKSWCRSRNLQSFLSNRVRRIYPGFITVLLLMQFVITPLISQGPVSAFSPRQIALTAFHCVNINVYPDNHPGPLILQQLPFKGELNGALWTIRYEFFCYLLVALLGVIGVYRRRWLVPFLCCVCLTAYAAEWTPPSNRLLTALFGYTLPWPRFLAFYTAGMAFFLYSDRIPRSAPLAAIAAAILLVSFAAPRALAITLPIAGTYFLFWLAFGVRTGLEGFARHGDFSYGIYLYGWPTQQLLLAHFGAGIPVAVLFLMAWPIAIVAGIVSWHVVEKRFIRRGHRPKDLPANAS